MKTGILTGIIKKIIDAKGRLSVPKRWRETLLDQNSNECILLKMDNCLQVYSPNDWSLIQSNLMQLSPFKDKTRQLQRLWGMSADLIELDPDGRMKLNRDQKQYADIANEVVLIGAINKIEIWSYEGWRSLMASTPRMEEIAEQLAADAEP